MLAVGGDMYDDYERFTQHARAVMLFSNQEAQRYRHEYIGTEHILLGLVLQGAQRTGVAYSVLMNLGLDLEKIRREVEKIIQPGPHAVKCEQNLFTPSAKKVIEYAMQEARRLKHNYVGTEHILIGLLREEEGVAAQVLTYSGIGLASVREEVLDLLGYNLPTVTSSADVPQRDFKETCAQVGSILDDFDRLIARTAAEKTTLVDATDFESAARVRDIEHQLKELRSKIETLLPKKS
jgi:ATP-dependent Clp protease ATP-binding subunit ClpA